MYVLIYYPQMCTMTTDGCGDLTAPKRDKRSRGCCSSPEILTNSKRFASFASDMIDNRSRRQHLLEIYGISS
jgi:hypothetical protein